MDSFLQLNSGVGRGQDNEEDDVYAADNALREIGAYQPPPEYASEPQRYTTEPMVSALENFQEQNGLKVDGYARPGGPTEQAINNRLTGKPRGAGLLYDFGMSIGDTVGNGFKNKPRDVETVKRALGGLGHLPEDPFDRPSGFIEESTTNAIRDFQSDNGLKIDGWMRPGGETEGALYEAIAGLGRSNADDWRAYWDRGRAAKGKKNVGYEENPAPSDFWTLLIEKPAIQQPKGNRTPSEWVTLLQHPRNAADGAEQFATTDPAAPSRQSQSDGEGFVNPEGNFGSWAIKRSDVLPEGVEPPDDPLKPSTLPSDIPGEVQQFDREGRPVPFDVGTDRKREVRWLISRLYRIGAQDERGSFRLSDRDFDAYLVAAKEHIKSEHYAVFELTARAVRAGALDWHTAATRLAAYYAPETTGEAVVDFLLDLTPIVGNLKAAKELHTALENAVDAAAYGDARAHDDALTRGRAGNGRTHYARHSG